MIIDSIILAALFRYSGSGKLVDSDSTKDRRGENFHLFLTRRSLDIL